MRNLIIINLIFLLQTFVLQAQTLIATSKHPEATANHNQRKIVRDTADNIYVVYQNILSNDTVIMGVYLNRETETWCEPFQICEGKNPTLAISSDCKIFLIYESSGNIPDIICRSSLNFINWSAALTVDETNYPCMTPVADVDQSGSVNIFWINRVSTSHKYINYALVQNDTVTKREYFLGQASDIAIANHLKYEGTKLFLVMESTLDDYDIVMFSTDDYWETWQNADNIIGHNPTITYNTHYLGYDQSVKVLYLNGQNKLCEAVSVFENNNFNFYNRQAQSGLVTYLCIDDIAPPIGNSYLFIRNNILYHSFSYGSADWFDDYEHGINYDFDILLDSVTTNPINPSIAYKHFRFNVVDFIWSENTGENFNIFYKRDDKYDPLATSAQTSQNHINVYASPNPFTDNVLIDFHSIKTGNITHITIFDPKGNPVFKTSTNQNSFMWDASDNSGGKVKSGYYIILTENNGKKIAGRILKL